ncbi:hypothetical protein HK104_000759 [Borealophlyctis nickersoniae]|nr:hypothetical protein HK104_000759 [Borealophlyctis nickersoniae]
MLSHPPEAEAYNSHKATSHGAPAICSVEEAALLVRLHQQNQLLTTQGFPSLPATSSPTPADVKSTLDIVSSLLASLNEAHQALDASTEQSARTRNDRAALQQRVERLTKDLARRDRKEEDGRVELADTKRALAKERERVKALETALKRARDEALVKGSECHGCGARKGGKGGFGWGIACGRCIDVVRDQGRWRQVERSWEDSLDERDGVYWDEVDGCYYYLDEEQEGDVVELGWSGDEREQLEAEIGMEVIPEEDTHY